MADETPETDPVMVNVDKLSDARAVCWQAAKELRSLVPGVDVAVFDHVADELDSYATALDDFMAELNGECSGEFDADRYPADPEPADEDDLVELVGDPEPLPDENEDDDEPELDHDVLYARAQKLDISGRTKMSDEELVEAIAKAESEA